MNFCKDKKISSSREEKPASHQANQSAQIFGQVGLCYEPKLLPGTVAEWAVGVENTNINTQVINMSEKSFLLASLSHPCNLKWKLKMWLPKEDPSLQDLVFWQSRADLGSNLLETFLGVCTPLCSKTMLSLLSCLFLPDVVLSSDSNSAENWFQPNSRSSVLNSLLSQLHCQEL